MPFPPHSDSNIQLVPQGRSGFPPASLTDNREYLSKHLENFLPLISLFRLASQPKPSDVLSGGFGSDKVDLNLLLSNENNRWLLYSSMWDNPALTRLSYATVYYRG